MNKAVQHRRQFLADAGLAATALICGGAALGHAAEPGSRLHVSINQWSVGAVRARDKEKSKISFDEELAELAACGLNGLEPGLGSADQVGPLFAQLKKHGMELRSIYTGSALDNRAKVGKEVERIVALAKRAKEVGTKIIVTNPSPLPNRQGKTDEQLKTQAAALNTVGHELAALGVTLAYHNHDVELQYAAREFHHMMLATDPRALVSAWTSIGSTVAPAIRRWRCSTSSSSTAPALRNYTCGNPRAMSGAKLSATATSTIASWSSGSWRSASGRTWCSNKVPRERRRRRWAQPPYTNAVSATCGTCSRPWLSSSVVL